MFYGLKAKPAVQYKTKKYSPEALNSKQILCIHADASGVLWVGTEQGLYYKENGVFIKTEGINAKVTAVFSKDEHTVFAAADQKVFTVTDKVIASFTEITSERALFCRGLTGQIWLADENRLYLFANGQFTVFSDMAYPDTTSLAAAEDIRVFAGSAHGIGLLHGKRPSWENALPEFTNVPDVKILSLKTDELGYVWVGTDEGLYLFDGNMEWKNPDHFDFIPKCPITQIEFGKTGEIFLGTSVGFYTVTAEKTRFFGFNRYLCGEIVNGIAFNEKENTVFVSAKEGISEIKRTEMSLSQKESYYQSIIPYYDREGYITMVHEAPENSYSSGKACITDNDGFWTADYIIAQSLKYAVTKDENDRLLAQRSMNALLKLETMTGIQGFPARAYRRPGEDRFGDGDPEWHLTEDEKGALEWKGETSSDELCGHFLASAAYYDFCADEQEKARIASAIGDIMSHIIENGWCLCDVDGKPTTWAHFGPDDLNGSLSWCWEKGVNSLEILSFLSTAYHITGNELFRQKKEELIKKYHYALNLTTHKVKDEHAVHIDDRLAYYALLPLIWYEKNPAVLRYLALATRRHYEYELDESCPFYIFITALLSNGHVELNKAIESLEEYPLDLYSYEVKNSARFDILRNNKVQKYGSEEQALFALPYSERVEGDICYNAYQLNGYARHSFMSPALWLCGYWLARYYRMLFED